MIALAILEALLVGGLLIFFVWCLDQNAAERREERKRKELGLTRARNRERDEEQRAYEKELRAYKMAESQAKLTRVFQPQKWGQLLDLPERPVPPPKFKSEWELQLEVRKRRYPHLPPPPFEQSMYRGLTADEVWAQACGRFDPNDPKDPESGS